MHGVWGGPRLRHRQCGASLTGVCCPQMQQMSDMIMQHKRAMQDMQLLWEKALQQHQHGYDSDEEVDSELGTWEHQLRRMEMDKTRGGQGGIPGWRGGVPGGGLPSGRCGLGKPTQLPRRYWRHHAGILSHLPSL